ncbi:DUF2759 family protein [Cohnella rhizosphaerae]|uniref:DUF2759 family protein n=1 Tax=Cohnella rhizosphaerae TaxID=1457232 RepID=A0A9X4KWR3_9BACL|nr:DUF2759 family protein [Cohnella rhizosphaerae]MDG0811943.1 DUF2759 family protein [Cohnella rhizosphaerae]
MFLAENAAESASTFAVFDIFMVIITVLIVAGLVRLVRQRPNKNIFAIGFTAVSLIVFLIADVKMVSGW